MRRGRSMRRTRRVEAAPCGLLIGAAALSTVSRLRDSLESETVVEDRTVSAEVRLCPCLTLWSLPAGFTVVSADEGWAGRHPVAPARGALPLGATSSSSTTTVLRGSQKTYVPVRGIDSCGTRGPVQTCRTCRREPAPLRDQVRVAIR